MQHQQRNLARLLFLTMATCLAGCGGSGGRVAVSGTVTVDGSPLESGAINFSPQPGTSAPSAGGAIIDGKFALPSSTGLMPGKYQVSVMAMKKTGKIVEDLQMGPVPEQVPLVFQETNLEAEITDGGAQQFEFQLTQAK